MGDSNSQPGPLGEYQHWIVADSTDDYLLLLGASRVDEWPEVRKKIDTRISAVRSYAANPEWGHLASQILNALGRARANLEKEFKLPHAVQVTNQPSRVGPLSVNSVPPLDISPSSPRRKKSPATFIFLLLVTALSVVGAVVLYQSSAMLPKPVVTIEPPNLTPVNPTELPVDPAEVVVVPHPAFGEDEEIGEEEEVVPWPPANIHVPTAPSQPLIVIPPIKLAISNDAISEFNTQMEREYLGDQAFLIYSAFTESYEFTPEQASRVQQRLARWEEHRGKERVGALWLAPDEALAKRQAADKLVSAATASIQSRDYLTAVKQLDEATKENPDAVKPKYLLGLLYSLPLLSARDTKIAKAQFEKIQKLMPSCGEALNSLAICELKERDYKAALIKFKLAAQNVVDASVIVHNLRRVVTLGERGTIKASQGELSSFTALADELVQQGRAVESQFGQGWIHMLPVFSVRDRELAVAGTSLGKEATGWAYAVASNVLLTSRSLVSSGELGVATQIIVVPTGASTREFSGQVLYLAEDRDLALIYAPGLTAQPLQIKSAVEGEQVIAVHPDTIVSNTLTEISGNVDRTPDVNQVSVPHSYLFSLPGKEAAEQWVVLNQAGELLSLISGSFPQASGQLYHGVAASEVSNLWDDYIAPCQPVEVNGQIVDDGSPLAEHNDQLRGATFRITTKYQAGAQSLTTLGFKQNVFDDRTCTRCNGSLWLPCVNVGCNQGQITEKYNETVVKMGRTVINMKTRKVDCPDCVDVRGNHCRSCNLGYE